ncbi:MAG: SPW repeat protein [Alphaproteobacteria bacterium]
MSTTYTTMRRPARENYWQDWANAILAIWLFISPWVLQYGSGYSATTGEAAGTGLLGAVHAAAWNAWVLGVVIFLVAISAISRMDFWQEYVNIVLSIWVFIAPWVLGFAMLGGASWSHWVVGVLVFLLSISVLSRARTARTVVTTPADRPVNRPPGGTL